MSRQAVRTTLLASIVVVLGAVFTSTVANAQGLTVTIGAPDLSTDRVSITVPVTVSCAPFDASLTHFASDVRVTVQQASGRQIARGTGSITSFLPDLLFPCDTTEHTLTVVVLADPLGPPFHGGPAALSARVTASAGTPCFPGSTNCFTNLSGQLALVGPTTVNLR